METNKPSAGTEAAERVADVLLAFMKGHDSLGVSAIARDLGLSKAVVHRVLQSLASRGLIEANPDTRAYSLGPAAAGIGALAMQKLNVRDAAREKLTQLRNMTMETTTLSLLVVDRRAYVDQYQSPHEIKMTVELGRFYPLHAGGSSRAILAHMPKNDVERIVDDHLSSLTSETLVDRDRLIENLEEVRRNGYAVSRGERQNGAGSVAAPIFGIDHRVIGSISVCGPLARFTPEAVESYIPLVVQAASSISQH
ncbi:MAG: IclR family transcriptional regulator [Cryobacterium sp.]|nr:IclR family transcriptional regulator [Cryobacterium sp.]